MWLALDFWKMISVCSAKLLKVGKAMKTSVKTSLTLKSKSIISRTYIHFIHTDFGRATQNYHTRKIKKKFWKNID